VHTPIDPVVLHWSVPAARTCGRSTLPERESIGVVNQKGEFLFGLTVVCEIDRPYLRGR
jgi:hypothetical protein